jgi:hypothetical protein
MDRIRAPFPCRFFEEETPSEILKHPGRRQVVRARFFLNSGSRITQPAAVSADSLTVELKKP